MNKEPKDILFDMWNKLMKYSAIYKLNHVFHIWKVT